MNAELSMPRPVWILSPWIYSIFSNTNLTIQHQSTALQYCPERSKWDRNKPSKWAATGKWGAGREPGNALPARTQVQTPESLLPFHGALLPPHGLTQGCKDGTGKGAFYEMSRVSLKPESFWKKLLRSMSFHSCPADTSLCLRGDRSFFSNVTAIIAIYTPPVFYLYFGGISLVVGNFLPQEDKMPGG